MKASELVEKSVDDLNKQLLDLREEQFKLRMAKRQDSSVRHTY